MRLRKATTQDIDLLIKLRFDYLIEDNGGLTQDEKTAIQGQLGEYFKKHIKDNTFIGVIAEMDNKVASTAYLTISERPANPAFITGKTGTLLNVLTYPEFRRKGIATKVVSFLIEEAKKAGVSSIDLLATDDGKPLYEKLGFTTLKHTAMRMKLV